MKRILLIFIGILAVCVLGAFFMVRQIDTEDVRKYLAEGSLQFTGKPLLLEQAPELSLFPLGLSFGKASWGMQDGKPAAHGISAAVGGGLIRLEILPLLSGKVDIKEVRLDSPSVTIKPEKDAATQPAQAAAPQQADGQSGGIDVALDTLRISNGSVAIQQDDGSLVQLDKLNIEIDDMRLGSVAKTHIDCTVKTTSPAFEGAVALDAYLQYLDGRLTVDKTKLRVSPTKGVLPFTKDVTLVMHVVADDKSVHVSKLEADLGGIPCSGDVLLGLGQVMAVKAQLELGEINVNALLAAQQKNAVPAAPRASRSTADKPTVYPSADVQLKVASVRYDGVQLKNVQATVQGKGGTKATYTVKPLGFALGSGGSYAGECTVHMPDGQWQSAGQAQGVQAGALMQALGKGRPLDGTAQLEYSLQGQGLSAAAIKQSLQGKGLFTMQSITLHSVSVLPKGSAAKGSAPTHFSRLSVPFTAQKGTVNLPNISLLGTGLDAAGKGTVRLPQESVQIALDIKTLGVTVPAVVSGTFSNLSYGIDPMRAAGQLLQAPGAIVDTGKSAGSTAGEALKGVGSGLKKLFGR